MTDNNNLIRRVKEDVPGVYMRLGDPHIMIIHLDEIIENMNLDDTEETRAVLWAAYESQAKASGLLLEIVETDKVNASARDNVTETPTDGVTETKENGEDDAS
jgi:hypothetical protein